MRPHSTTILLLVGALLGIAGWRTGRLQLLGQAINGSKSVTGSGIGIAGGVSPFSPGGSFSGDVATDPSQAGQTPGQGGVAPQSGDPSSGFPGLLVPKTAPLAGMPGVPKTPAPVVAPAPGSVYDPSGGLLGLLTPKGP